MMVPATWMRRKWGVVVNGFSVSVSAMKHFRDLSLNNVNIVNVTKQYTQKCLRR